MAKLGVLVLGIIGVAALLTMLGSGVASAKDPLIGKTYDDAASWVAGRSGNSVVGTVSGAQLRTGDCIVVSWHKSIFLDASGDNAHGNDYILNINCNNHVASAGKPGNSVMTPEGAQAKKDDAFAAKINENPAWCDKSAEKMDYCKTICERTGLCEIS